MAYDYTKYSFDQLHAEITRKLIANSEWADIGDSATSQTLIQLLSYTVDKLHYMLERRTQESFLPTAILPTSIKALASQVGYLPRRKVSAEGSTLLTIVDVNGTPISPAGNIVLPRFTPVLFNGEKFLTKQEYAVTPTETSAAIDIIEGERVLLSIDINDTAGTLYNYSYIEIADFESIEEDSIEVYTNSQTFNNVLTSIGGEPPIESLEFANHDDLVFDVKITHNGMRILLGDGTNGAIPVGATLFISYINSSGDEVDVSEIGKTFSFETDLLEDDIVVLPKNTYRYTLTNTTAIDGGIAEETLDQIRRNAPNFARTGNRAVTKFDYEYWVKLSGIAGIVDAKSYSEQEVGYNAFNMNNVYVSYLKNDGTVLTTAEKIEMDAYMERYKSVTAHVVYHDPNIIPLAIALTGKKNTDLPLSNSEFYDALKLAVEEYFAFVDGSLGKTMYISQLMTYLSDYTVTKNGVTRLLVDFVDITAKALWSITSPITTQTQVITLTRGATSHVYNFVINGHTYTYTQQAADVDENTLANNVQLYLDGGATAGAGDTLAPASTALIVGQTYEILTISGADYTTVGATANTVGLTFVATGTSAGGTGTVRVPVDALQVSATDVTLSTTVDGVPFTISNTGSSVPANIYMEQTFQLPKATILATPTETFLQAGSVEIITPTGTLIYVDDGVGNIGPTGGTVDYITGEIKLNVLSDGDYYIRYNHTSSNNFIASKREVYSYSPPKSNFFDVTELLSTITITT